MFFVRPSKAFEDVMFFFKRSKVLKDVKLHVRRWSKVKACRMGMNQYESDGKRMDGKRMDIVLWPLEIPAQHSPRLRISNQASQLDMVNTSSGKREIK
jgi:hypothetical protein